MDIIEETKNALMSTLRHEKEVTSVYLSNDTDEYTLKEIADESDTFIKDWNSKQISNYDLIVNYKLRPWADDDYARIDIVYYRLENNEELEARLKLEEAQQKRRDELKAKKEQREADPEYQKYMELHNKFTMKL